MRRYLPFVIVVGVALATLASGTMLYRAKRIPPLTFKNHVVPGKDDAVHVLGAPNALVTLEEFGDFQCPPCGALAGPINQLEHDYQPRLRVIFRHLPIAAHQHAREAAHAAEAAGMQDRFWEMHHLLYREQAVWSKAPNVRMLFNAYAGILGLNIERFDKDMESDKAKARVDFDEKEAAAIGVKNTPTIFLDNQAIPPTELNPADLRAAVDAAVNNVRPPS